MQPGGSSVVFRMQASSKVLQNSEMHERSYDVKIRVHLLRATDIKKRQERTITNCYRGSVSSA